MEAWQLALGVGGLLLGIGGFLSPIVMAARNRDATLVTMIGQNREAASEQIKDATDPIHDRINRVRDEYVRRDDLDGHLRRIDKQMDELKTEVRIGNQIQSAKITSMHTDVMGALKVEKSGG